MPATRELGEELLLPPLGWLVCLLSKAILDDHCVSSDDVPLGARVGVVHLFFAEPALGTCTHGVPCICSSLSDGRALKGELHLR